MKKCIGIVAVLLAFMLVSTSFGAINQSQGSAADMWMGTQGIASNNGSLCLGNDQFAHSGLDTTSQSYAAIANGNVDSGRRGSSLVDLNLGTIQDQTVGRGYIGQDQTANLGLVTNVQKNGSSVGSAGVSANQTATGPGMAAISSTTIIAFSASMVQSSPCFSNNGSALGSISVSSCGSQMVSGGCH